MNGGSSSAAVAHRQDDGGAAPDHVSTRKHIGNIGLPVGINHNLAAFGQKLWGGALHGWVGALTDRHHHRIHRHAEFRTRHGNR